MSRNYYADADGFVFVVDSADVERLEECSIEFQELLEEQKLAGLPVLVYANKMDLPSAMSEQDIAEALDLHSIRDRPWQIQVWFNIYPLYFFFICVGFEYLSGMQCR